MRIIGFLGVLLIISACGGGSSGSDITIDPGQILVLVNLARLINQIMEMAQP